MSFTTCSVEPACGVGFCLIDALRIATMSQKSSVIQAMHSVQLVLMSDRKMTSPLIAEMGRWAENMTPFLLRETSWPSK
jgi:hypothetical protein